MASDKRPIIKLRSTAGTGFTYVRKHVIFKEER